MLGHGRCKHLTSRLMDSFYPHCVSDVCSPKKDFLRVHSGLLNYGNMFTGDSRTEHTCRFRCHVSPRSQVGRRVQSTWVTVPTGATTALRHGGRGSIVSRTWSPVLDPYMPVMPSYWSILLEPPEVFPRLPWAVIKIIKGSKLVSTEASQTGRADSDQVIS